MREVRRGTIHSVTMELTARRELDKKCEGFMPPFSRDLTMIRLCSSVSEPTVWIVVRHDLLKYFNQEIVAKLLAYIIKIYLPEIVLALATTAGRTYLPAVAAMVHTG
ncbi:MAG: hypothetical protein ACLUEQ_06360 [Cloacibacillus evryensis]